MSQVSIEITAVDPRIPEALGLIRALSEELAQRFGLDGADGRIEQVFDAAGETGITIPKTGLHAFGTTVWRLRANCESG